MWYSYLQCEQFLQIILIIIMEEEVNADPRTKQTKHEKEWKRSWGKWKILTSQRGPCTFCCSSIFLQKHPWINHPLFWQFLWWSWAKIVARLSTDRSTDRQTDKPTHRNSDPEIKNLPLQYTFHTKGFLTSTLPWSSHTKIRLCKN